MSHLTTPAHLTQAQTPPPRRHLWARRLGVGLLGAAAAVGIWWTTVDNDLIEPRQGWRQVVLTEIWIDSARDTNGDIFLLDKIEVPDNHPDRPYLDDAAKDICPAPCWAEVRYSRTLSTYHKETRTVPVRDIMIVGESLSEKTNKVCRKVLGWGCWNSEIEKVGRALSRGGNA